MGAQKYLIPAMLLAMLVSASAAITVIINEPAAGQVFYPKLNGDTFMDINITVVDSVAGGINSVHEAGIQFKNNDTNIFISVDSNASQPGTDENLSTGNCHFWDDTNFASPGVDCVFRYTFPTGTPLGTGTYVLDVNVSGYSDTATGRDVNASKSAVTTFRMDNRLVDTGAASVIALITIVMAAVLLFAVIAAWSGSIDPKTILMVVGAALTILICVLFASELIALFTP